MPSTDWQFKMMLEGDKETSRMFKKLAEPQQKQVLKSSTKKGAILIRNEARMRAPVKTGTLIRNINEVLLLATNYFSDFGVSFRVNNQSDGYYGLFIEKGTKPRYQKNRKSERYSVPKYVGVVGASPFLEPAFEAKKGQASKIIIEALKKSIFQVAKKWGFKR
tara:strand:+ start:2331 stop:2819 length:489 start_codon:yes stop_codon:yes gene_type:complete